MPQFNFISGLPRSGTTLLSTILNQNPNFQASISGPLARFARAIVEQSSAQGGYRTQCPPEKNKKIIQAIFDTYYDDKSKTNVFDTNRGWTLLTPLLKELNPDFKMIVCVRDIPWILDSFEQIFRKNPMSLSLLYPEGANANVYSRASYMMAPESPLGFAYNGVKQAMTSNEKTHLMVVDYDIFVKNPKQMMQAIYKFIGQPYFEHDFDNVEASYDEFDADVNTPGLHTTRKKVSYVKRDMVLPPDIVQQYSGFEVWK